MRSGIILQPALQRFTQHPGHIGLWLTADSEYIAAIRFRGYASNRGIKKYAEKLRKLLEKNEIEYYGNFRYLGYNPPYQFIGRRNEVIVSVNLSEKNLFTESADED